VIVGKDQELIEEIVLPLPLQVNLVNLEDGLMLVRGINAVITSWEDGSVASSVGDCFAAGSDDGFKESGTRGGWGYESDGDKGGLGGSIEYGTVGGVWIFLFWYWILLMDKAETLKLEIHYNWINAVDGGNFAHKKRPVFIVRMLRVSRPYDQNS
jgi:hypothetical protein